MKLLLVIDIDGTMADLRSRSKRAGNMPPREKKHLFQMWLDRLQTTAHLLADPPISQVVELVRNMAKVKGVTALYLTGRSEKYRWATEKWLKKVKAPMLPLYMREVNDWRNAKSYKKEAMKRLIKKHKVSPRQVLVIDDDGDGDCSAMYLRLGVVHLKVVS